MKGRTRISTEKGKTALWAISLKEIEPGTGGILAAIEVKRILKSSMGVICCPIILFL